MKILRKNDEFRKMKDKSIQDVLAIRNLINQEWNYCSKQVYKDFFRKEEKPEKKKSEKN